MIANLFANHNSMSLQEVYLVCMLSVIDLTLSDAS